MPSGLASGRSNRRPGRLVAQPPIPGAIDGSSRDVVGHPAHRSAVDLGCDCHDAQSGGDERGASTGRFEQPRGAERRENRQRQQHDGAEARRHPKPGHAGYGPREPRVRPGREELTTPRRGCGAQRQHRRQEGYRRVEADRAPRKRNQQGQAQGDPGSCGRRAGMSSMRQRDARDEEQRERDAPDDTPAAPAIPVQAGLDRFAAPQEHPDQAEDDHARKQAPLVHGDTGQPAL